MKAVTLIVVLAAVAAISQAADWRVPVESTNNSVTNPSSPSRCIVGGLYFAGRNSSGYYCDREQDECWPEVKVIEFHGFTDNPTVITAINRLDSGEQPGYGTTRVVSEVIDVSSNTAKIRVEPWGGALLFSLGVSYVVCGE